MQDERIKASLANAVVRLFRLVNRLHNRSLKPLAMSAEQAHILTILSIAGPMTIGRLQKHLALSSPTLTGAIDRMEAQGLVRRVPSPDDRRAVLLEHRLSARRLAQIEQAIDEGEHRCFSALTAGERRELGRLLDKCIEALEPDVDAH